MFFQISVLSLMLVAVSAQNCVPLAQLKQCQGVPILVSQKQLELTEGLFMYGEDSLRTSCPAVAAKFDANPFIYRLTCAMAEFTGVKECNPGKPTQLCKKTCLKAFERQGEILRDDKCDAGTFTKNDKSQCDSLPETDCYEISLDSTSDGMLMKAPISLVATAFFLALV